MSDRPDRAGRHLLTFSDGSTMRLYRQTIEDFGLYTGLELEKEQLAALRTAAGQMSAKMRAVRIVAASNVSQKDLQQRLVRKGESEIQAAEAVRWMEELNLVDDLATARQIVDRCIRQGYGLSRAKQALYEKRIPKEYWEDALADYPDQEEKIESFLRSRLDEDSDQKEIKRAIDALMRRGHSYSTVRRVLNNLSFEADDYFED